MKRSVLLAGMALLLAAFGPKKEKAFIPPGTVSINDTLFADETEVSNFAWKEYVMWMAATYGKESVEYKSTLPDTLVWRNKLAFNEPYVEYYYSHPAYKNYPVVGISYEQAVSYCKWRTQRVHVYVGLNNGTIKPMDMNKEYKGTFKFEYRLPTKQEWEALALPGLDKANKEKAEKNKSQLYNALYDVNYASALNDNADVTAPVYSYWPNKLGIYNSLGNVSEMVAEKGIAKGGNWKTHAVNLSIWTDEEFVKPNSWTGFRCVCVIKK